jgi:hypothetical protein
VSRNRGQAAAGRGRSGPDTSKGCKWSELPWCAWRERGVAVSFGASESVPNWYCENAECCYLLYVQPPFVRVEALPFDERYWIRQEWWYAGRGRITWEDLKAMAESLLARGRGKRPAKGKTSEQLPKAFVKEYPVLSAYMTEGKDESGAERDVSKVTVFVDQDSVKATLSDPSNECSLYVTLDAPGAVWEALEARLASGEADWRSWQGGKSRKKGK